MALADDDYMLTAEELRRKRQHRRRVIALVIGILVVLGLVALVARPTRNAIKRWQARRHAGNAFALIDKQEWNFARGEAVAAYQLSPTEPEAVRAIARLLSRTHQIQALQFWDQLAKITPLTREDLRDEAASALLAGNTSRANAAIELLLQHDPEAADLLLDARLAAQFQSIDRAREDCEKVVLNAGASSREQLQACVLELQLVKNASSEQADPLWARIEKLAQGKDAVSLDALMLLAQRALSTEPAGANFISPQQNQPDDREVIAQTSPSTLNHQPSTNGLSRSQLAHALESHPFARATHKLVALDLLERADPSQHETLIERGIAQFKTGDAEDIAALARWLNGKGEHQRVINSISREVLNGRDALLQYLDALGALNRWADIKRLLESERFPLEPFLQRMYLARCNAQLGEKAAAQNNWERAVEAAAGDASKLMQVGEFAEKNGVLDIADKAYAGAIREIPNLRAAYQGRLRVAQASHQTKRIHDLLAEMLAIWADDTAVQNDEAYTRLLLLAPTTLNDPRSNLAELREIQKVAETLVQHEPKSLPHRTLLALVRLRAGLPSSALDAYGIEVPDEARTASAIAVRYAVLMANDRIEEAKKVISELQVDQLLPEERSLVDQQ